jgi:hypothetical protein
MRIAAGRKWSVLTAGAVGVLLGVALLGHSEPAPTACLDLDQLQSMSPAELDALFRKSEVGKPFAGTANGRLLFLTDKRLPKLKVQLANSVWRGKMAREDGYFINRFIGNINWIDSKYVVGPSWVDGKPAIIMEYAPGTPLFANMHDELREVAPGLYMGPVYERCPCPHFRGYVALQIDDCYCEKEKRLFRRR